MGVYDEYGTIGLQLKVGPCLLTQYNIGDKVPISDGVYVGYEGVIVVKDGVLVSEFKELTDKYGGSIEPSSVFHNPLEDICNQFIKDSTVKTDRIKDRYERTVIASPDTPIVVHHGDCSIFSVGICNCGLLHDLSMMGVGMETIYPKYWEDMEQQEKAIRIIEDEQRERK